MTTARDRRIADEVESDSRLMCAANRCPNRWSVSKEGARGLCRWHAWAPEHSWPRITQEQLDAELDRAAYPQPKPQSGQVVSLAERIEALQRLRELASKGVQQ